MVYPVFATTRLMICVLGVLATSVCFCSQSQAQNRQGTVVDLTDLYGDDFQLKDIGRRSDGGLNVIGNGLVGGENVARLIEIAPDRTSFTSSELIGVRDTSEVFGISSDGSRVAGRSIFSNLSDAEATTWLANTPTSGVGLGFGGSIARLSGGFGAWSDGVVGSNAGASDAFKWSSSNNNFQLLPDSGGNSEASDVSSNGSIVAGFSSDFGAIAGATFWDDSGIHQLADPFGRDSRARTISPNAEYIGGDLVIFNAFPLEAGTQAALWSGDNYDLTLLETLDDSDQLMRLFGTVADVSDSGWVVGGTADDAGFIWHESFNGIDSQYLGAQDFNAWLELETGLLLPTASTSVVGISEDSLTGELSFAVRGSAYVVTVSAVPEPSAVVTLLAFCCLGIHRRNRRAVSAE